MRHFAQTIIYNCSLSDMGAHIRYFWLSGDRSNLVFAITLISIFTFLSVFIVNSIQKHHQVTELKCLALNIYHEARGEPDEGKFAVASVTLNRVKSKHYPDTICKVVYQKRWDYLRKRYVSAFSWTEFDETPETNNNKAWVKATTIAQEIYHNPDAQNLKQALFYHARNIRPSWARKKIRVAMIGHHIFYN